MYYTFNAVTLELDSYTQEQDMYSNLDEIDSTALMPFNATFKEPLPKKDGFIVMWDTVKEDWEYSENLNGKLVTLLSSGSLVTLGIETKVLDTDMYSTELPTSEHDEWDTEQLKWVLNEESVCNKIIHEFEVAIEECRKDFIGNPAPYEVISNLTKLQNARDVLSGTASLDVTKVVELEAANRGKKESAKDLAEKQLAKGSLISKASAIIDPVSREFRVSKITLGQKELTELATKLMVKLDKDLSKLK
jgi:hypothetical protein